LKGNKLTHKFEFNKRKKLISEKRKSILPAMEILLDIGLKEGNIFADIGCGIGYFSFPASEVVGKKGKVYAMDISQDMLNEIKKEIDDKKITNIELVKTSENNLEILDDTVDFAFASTVLHEADDLYSLLIDIRRVMINKGKFVIIEWNEVKRDLGPPINHRLSSNELSRKLGEIGFKNIKTSDLNEYFYDITCYK
jgi:ubiquinone/menaquinone biosynthesis C-methylase UbiE